MFRKSVFALKDEEDVEVDGPGMDGSAGGKGGKVSKSPRSEGGQKEKWKGLHASAREKEEAETEQWRKFATLKRQLEKHRTTVTLLLRQDEKAKQVRFRNFNRYLILWISWPQKVQLKFRFKNSRPNSDKTDFSEQCNN